MTREPRTLTWEPLTIPGHDTPAHVALEPGHNTPADRADALDLVRTLTTFPGAVSVQGPCLYIPNAPHVRPRP